MELKIEHLTKQFKDKMAVDDASLTLTPGVWGLLGANGAGEDYSHAYGCRHYDTYQWGDLL